MHAQKVNKKNQKFILQQYLSMYRRRELETFDQIYSVPTQYNKRNCTDIFCLIIGLVYSLILIILAIVLFNYRNFYQANFPADSAGNLCGIDKQAYPYIYFANAPDIDRRVCVQSCPKPGDEGLKCVPTQNIGCLFSNTAGFQVKYYDSEPQKTRSEWFCMPKDQSLKQKVLQNSQLKGRNLFYNSIDTILLCFLVALGFAIVYMLLVQFLPKVMNLLVVVLGSLIILASAICIFTYNTQATAFKIVIGCVLIIIFLVILCISFKHMNSLRMYGVFLQYATKFIRDRPSTFLYIPIFFLALIGLAVMVVLQFTAYWSSGDLHFDEKTSLFHELKGGQPIVLTVFLAIQLIWGLAFLKMAFNFCISGEAVLWYYNKKQAFCQPMKLLLCRHLGSVIGGSFIIAFLTPLDFLLDFLKPPVNADPNALYTRCYKNVCCVCDSVLDLVRTDAMAYMALTGNPFCNSARYCEYLCEKSVITDYSESVGRVYRLCAHLLLVGILIVFAMYIKGMISIYALIIIIVNTIFISTLFISLHADAAQAMQIIFLTDEELGRRRNSQNIDKYDPNLTSNFAGVMHQDLIQQVRQERIKQKVKPNDIPNRNPNNTNIRGI